MVKYHRCKHVNENDIKDWDNIPENIAIDFNPTSVVTVLWENKPGKTPFFKCHEVDTAKGLQITFVHPKLKDIVDAVITIDDLVKIYNKMERAPTVNGGIGMGMTKRMIDFGNKLMEEPVV